MGSLFANNTEQARCCRKQRVHVISQVLSTCSLVQINLLLQLALEATPDDLALTGLQPVRDGRNRTDVIRHREQDELLVDEVRVADLVRVVVEERPGLRAVRLDDNEGERRGGDAP